MAEADGISGEKRAFSDLSQDVEGVARGLRMGIGAAIQLGW